MNRKRLFIIGFVSILMVVVISISYAYFTGTVNGEDANLTVTSKEIKIVFTDVEVINDLDITPGWTNSKSFSVENQSTTVFNYNIVMKDLINTFVTDGSLQYRITSTNGYNMTEWVDVPKSSTPSDIILAYDIDIEKDDLHEYKIEFRYLNLDDVDQSEDIDKEFSGTLAIIDGTVNPNIKYSVTLNVENGSVISENPQETIKNGVLEFNVISNEGYTLGNVVTCDNGAVGVIENGKVTIGNIKSNNTCTLNSEQIIHTVEMKVVNGKTNALNKLIPYNGTDTFEITPNTGYTLTGATLTGEGCSINGNIVTVSNVKKDGTCTLTLAKEKYNVILTGSNVTVSDSPKTVEYEGSTTFNVSANEGYTLGNVVTCDNNATGSISGSVVTVNNVTTDTSCTIDSNINMYTINLKVTNGTSDYENKQIPYNGTDTFEITPNTGYTLTGATLTGEGCSINGNIVTVSNVKSNGTCTLTLAKEKYNVILTGSNVTVSDSPKTVEYEGSTTFNVSPNTGFTMSNATVNCDGGATGSISGNTVTVSNVLKAQTCTITPKQLEYEVTLVVVNGTGNTTKNVAHGSSTTFSITANTNYTLDSPTISCTGSATTSISSGTLTVSNVTGAQTCTVTLKLVKRKVTVSVTGGSSNPTSRDIDHNGSGTFDITASTNYDLANATVSGTGCSLGAVSNNKRVLTASSVTSDRTCTVTIPLKTYSVSASITGGSLDATSKTVSHGSNATFTVTASTNYDLSSATVSGTGCSLSSDKKTLTVSNITGTGRTCTVTIPLKEYSVIVTSNNTNYGTVSPTNQVIEHGSSATITLTPKTGYEYSSNTCGGTVSGNTMTISNITESKTCTVTFTTYTPKGNTLYSVLTSGNYYTTIKTRASGDFDAPLGGTTATTGYDTTKTIYKESTYKEDGLDVYYFAGNPQDNWVKFAGFYWRIIRTNEDGSVRLLYAGTSHDTTSGYIIDGQQYNSTYTNTIYVGWMYGSTGSLDNNRGNTKSSLIKTKVESWYSTNITGENAAMVSTDAIYCNDRSGDKWASSGAMSYAANYRLGTVTIQPTYQCGGKRGSTTLYSDASSADKFSKTTGSGGNGLLSQPVGLMTADEVAFAGGRYGINAPNTYYYNNSQKYSVTNSSGWWTMTPNEFDSNSAYVFDVNGSSFAYYGRLSLHIVGGGNAVRPVISLKSCVTVSNGNGTADNPYEVEASSTCATANN